MFKKISFKKRDDKFTPNIEIIWVEIEKSNRKYFVGVVYRTPSAKAKFVNQLALPIENALNTELLLFLFCDFNFDMLVDGNNPIKQMLQNFFLCQMLWKNQQISQHQGVHVLILS